MLPDGSSMDHAAAQKLSDSYMSDLVANHVDLALGKMETQFLQAAGGKTHAESGVRDLFNYCGRPLESELRHEETAEGCPCVRLSTLAKQPSIQRESVFSLSGLCRPEKE